MAALSLSAAVLTRCGCSLRHRTRTFWGGEMTVALPEAVSSEIARFGYIEEPVARALIAHVRPGDVVLDVGGHFGFFSLLAAELVGPQGQVHTFEPVPATFGVLSGNAQGKPITVNNLAVWNCAHTIAIQDYGLSLSAFNSVRTPRLKNGSGRAPTIHQIPAVTLDDYTAARTLRPSFAKIDAESAEYEVLQGMQRVIAECRPVICLELGDVGVADAVKSRELVEWLIAHGYAPLEWSGKGFVSHQLKADYAYTNLLFAPRG